MTQVIKIHSRTFFFCVSYMYLPYKIHKTPFNQNMFFPVRACYYYTCNIFFSQNLLKLNIVRLKSLLQHLQYHSRTITVFKSLERVFLSKMEASVVNKHVCSYDKKVSF